MSGILGLAAPRADLGGPYLEAAPSNFGERFSAAWDESLAPNRWFNIEGARYDKWQTVIDALHTATGKTYDNPLAFAGAIGPDGQAIDPVAVRQQREQAIIQAHAEATRDVGAELPDPNMIEPEIQQESRAIGQRAQSLVGTGGGMGAFFGAALAPTPENLAGLLIPPSRLVLGAMPVARGFLANVGREALFQAGANAALTGASDLADVATGAKKIEDVPGDVAGAAAFGGVLGGVFHTPAALWERWNALPQAVRDTATLKEKDAWNVIEREALFPGSNIFGLDPAEHEKAVNDAVNAIIAYHGSPHLFDQFDSAHIGNGEGAQAFGHGLYFAENPEVAHSYQRMLNTEPPKLYWDGKEIGLNELVSSAWPHLSTDAKVHRGVEHGIGPISAAIERGTPENELRQKFDLPTDHEIIDLLQKHFRVERPGALYEVALNADKNLFLDWDKPIAEQTPEVKAALAGVFPGALESKTAGSIYLEKPTAEMSASLREAGIPGIKYLDQGSRDAARIDGRDLAGWKAEAERADAEAARLRKEIEDNRANKGLLPAFFQSREKQIDELQARKQAAIDNVRRIESGEGQTHNFVIFPGNEHLIQILKRNGEPVTSEVQRQFTNLQKMGALQDQMARAPRTLAERIAESEPKAPAAEPDVSGLLKNAPPEIREKLLAEHEAVTKDEAIVNACLGKAGGK